MAASWTITGHLHENTSQGTHTLLTASALAFGGGSQWDPILTAIQVDDANTSLHIGGTVAADSPDTCEAPHLHALGKPINTVAGAYVDTTPAASIVQGWIGDGLTTGGGYVPAMDVSSPGAHHGIRFLFNYDNAVEITNAEIWAGTGAQVTVTDHDNCGIWMVELNTSAGNVWVQPYYGNTLALTEKSSKEANSAENHNWYIGISVVASAVGFEADNKFKITTTYQ